MVKKSKSIQAESNDSESLKPAKRKSKSAAKRKLVLVETISIFKQSYAIECSELEHASDTVVCEEAMPFDGQHLDEVITTVREITMDDYDKLVAKSESADHMGRQMISRIDYESQKVVRPYLASGKKSGKS